MRHTQQNIQMTQNTPSIHDSACLYLKRIFPMRGSPYYRLTLMLESQASPNDVLIIHDIPVKDINTSLYFVVLGSSDANGRIHTDRISFTVADYNQSVDCIISEFYKKQPNFELCSPGFPYYIQYENWLRTHIKKICRKKYLMLEIPWYSPD